MWRGINGMKPITVDGKTELRGGRLDDKSYVSAFRLQTYIATQFKPNVAKTIYQMTNAKRVLDTSCGGGAKWRVLDLIGKGFKGDLDLLGGGWGG